MIADLRDVVSASMRRGLGVQDFENVYWAGAFLVHPQSGELTYSPGLSGRSVRVVMFDDTGSVDMFMRSPDPIRTVLIDGFRIRFYRGPATFDAMVYCQNEDEAEHAAEAIQLFWPEEKCRKSEWRRDST